MHAKTPFLSQTRLPDAGTIAAASVAVPDRSLSVAFSRVIGGKPPKPHLDEAAGKTARSRLKAEKIAGPAPDRVVAVKPIAPRSGHR